MRSSDCTVNMHQLNTFEMMVVSAMVMKMVLTVVMVKKKKKLI